MNRRAFLKTGAGCAIGGVAVSGCASASRASGVTGEGGRAQGSEKESGGGRCREPAWPIITASADDHRRRLRNIAECERGIRKCLRRHFITDYLPGQVVYNLGEYPCRRIWDPDEWDEQHLDELAAAGIRLVQVHEEWNDSRRLFGADKFTPCNEKGFRRFVDMVHRRGMKIIVYASTGFFERRDPDFRPEWTGGPDLVEIYFHYARCSPASPGWRSYLLPRLVRILDEYGVDGLYNDLGYVPPKEGENTGTDEVRWGTIEDGRDPALEDLLGIVYGEVKRRGGIFKVHSSAMNLPATRERLYDYLWVGEGVREGDAMRDRVKAYPPYVVPCLDMSRATIEREDDLYLQSMPYMQFPLLLAGRPFTGERAAIPGIEYPPEEKCFWTRHLRAIWRYYQAHPEGPYSYGWWDSCPGRPEARPTYYRWLKRYRPMVEPGTYAYVELADSDFFQGPLPEGVVATAFANRDLYLVLANYGRAPAEVATSRLCVACHPAEPSPHTKWSLPPRSLTILRRVDTAPD